MWWTGWSLSYTNWILLSGSLSLTKSCYSLGRAVGWVVFSSSALLFMPVMLETERLQLQDQQKAQKNQILLGPGEQAERTDRPTYQPTDRPINHEPPNVLPPNCHD